MDVSICEASAPRLPGSHCHERNGPGNTALIAADARLDTFVVKRAKEEEDEAGALDWDSATTMICDGMLYLA